MESIGRRLNRRWNTLRTDLRWLGRELRGHHRPYVVERGRSRYEKQPAPPVGVTPRPLAVAEVVRETPDAVSVRLAEVDGSPLRFEAGQFLTFHLDVDGQALRRAYSLSSSPLDGPTATITVKRVDGGRASSWIHDHLAPGATLRALGPSGSFVARDVKELVLIAGGSGITPIVSLAETALRTRDDVSVRLVYGNRGEGDIIFRDRLAALARSHDALTVDHVLESPPEGWTGRTGRLDAEVLAGWLDALGEADSRAYWICGPEPMMDAARDALRARGVPADAIFEERFRSPGDAPSAVDLPKETVTVRLRVDDADHLVPVAPGDTLLEAGLAAGADMPFSCAMGGCAACKCKLVEGEVLMEEPNCLSDAERADGWVLACVSRPMGAANVEVEK